MSLYNPLDCSPPSSSFHEILQARILEWIAIPFSRGIFLTQGFNPGLLHWGQIIYHLSHQELFALPLNYEIMCDYFFHFFLFPSYSIFPNVFIIRKNKILELLIVYISIESPVTRTTAYSRF